MQLMMPGVAVPNPENCPLIFFQPGKGDSLIYKDFMLLAFTHFNEQNEAYVSNAGYEQCLRNMWKEISRTYANKPVTLPLLGSGVTRFSDSSEKTNYSLLKCILCTYRTSSVKINQQITILLTKDTLETINLYDLKGE